jgi:hypothetical protein
LALKQEPAIMGDPDLYKHSLLTILTSNHVKHTICLRLWLHE